MLKIYAKLIELEKDPRNVALCTVIHTKGSTPRKIGAKMIVLEDGNIFGSIGGGALEKKIIDQAKSVINDGIGEIFTHQLVNQLGMCCGGNVQVYIEPIKKRMELYIFGAGHIGKNLARFSSGFDFNVTLIDERIEMTENLLLPEVKILNENHVTAIERLPFRQNPLIVIVTHDHGFDRELLSLALKRKTSYIGMIGSERKVAIAKKNLQGSGFSEEEINKVDMPMGIPINAITPEEISISILAKLIDVRNKLLGNKSASRE